MKLFKLWVHQKNYSDDELVLNPKDFPDIKVGDVVEIYHTDEDYSRLLLQVKSLREDVQHKDAVVSVAQNIANYFHLRMYKDVFVNPVNPKDVALDLVELNYREQYFSRADMWRLRKTLVSGCLFLTQKVRFAEMRAQVNELWSKGEKVMCGYVTDDTKVTYRSSTAQVNIFLQMSSEMWEFDNYGDLYFEKAVDGFLLDLFSKWKEKSCNHDVTITLFSRNFYDAKSIEEFPMHMRECVQQDYLGRFYEDFYRVVVQNEKYDDWTNTVIKIKTFFNNYVSDVVHYHEQPGVAVPKACNSTSAQGNLLEVLNMALNVFEKYYLDRCFDRTGKLSIVITPGAGVFDVDRQLTHVTKHRTIDCGNSSDLVCLGEQPLHAVPLFKFHNKNPSRSLDVGDDYNIPHWINHSFYTSQVQASRIKQGKFIPRIKMPQPVSNMACSGLTNGFNQCGVTTAAAVAAAAALSDPVPFVDYEEYDAQVFHIPSHKPSVLLRCKPHGFRSALDHTCPPRMARLQFCGNTRGLFHQSALSQDQVYGTAPIDMPRQRPCQQYMFHTFHGHDPCVHVDPSDVRGIAGSCGSPVGYQSRQSLYTHKARQALINPFAPSRLHFKVTSNRRRWAHAFPTDPQGAAMQPHHSSRPNGSDTDITITQPPTREVVQAAQLAVDIRRQRTHKASESSDGGEHSGRMKSQTISSSDSIGSSDSLRDYSSGRERVSFGKELVAVSSSSRLSIMTTRDSSSSVSSMIHSADRDTLTFAGSGGSGGRSRTHIFNLYGRSLSAHRDLSGMPVSNDGHNWLWGITGEQEWTPEMKTGVDWKSTTMPASLPITTDYFPDTFRLETEYLFKNYTLIPEDVNMDQNSRLEVKRLLTTIDVYKEMISQRLAQGFQIVVLPRPVQATGPPSSLSSSPYQTTPTFLRRPKAEPMEDDIILSIGRIFHRVSLRGPSISVTTYWPRHPYPQKSYHYTYRFQVPDSHNYDVSWTDFSTEKLETYKWNYVDSYLCTRGEDDFLLVESLKYWRSRFFLLPCNNIATKKIIDGATRCDIYEDQSPADHQQLEEGFLRFIEILNKIKRPIQTRMANKQKDIPRRASLTPSSPVVNLSGMLDKTTADNTPIKVKVIDFVAMVKVTGKVADYMESPPVGIADLPSRKTPGGLQQDTSTGAGGRTDTTNNPGHADRASFNLSTQSPLTTILSAMMDQNDGLNFLKPQSRESQGAPTFPGNTFVSAEAVTWAKTYVHDVKTTRQAVALYQRMVDDHLLCHVSGSLRHRFIHGFYLYHIVDKEKRGDQQMYPPYMFNPVVLRDWCEVALLIADNTHTASPVPFFDDPLPQPPQCDIPNVIEPDVRISQLELNGSDLYKLVNVDVDPNRKSDRDEWGTARYHTHHTPMSAFELEVQWLVATGCIIGDLVMTWSRKASPCGFHFLPVPCDPFALPFTRNSDPLRGPIFVPLNVDCLVQPGKELFDEFSSDTREERLVMLQDSILKRFGFLPDKSPMARVPNVSFSESSHPHYVHCSGGMFVMIPDTKTSSPRNKDGTHRKVTVGSFKEYLAYQTCLMDTMFACGGGGSDTDSATHASFYQVGFLWSWNYMLTKRWRSSHTGEEHFQDNMLADFRAFCSNADNRFVDYWHDCVSRHQKHMAQVADDRLPKEAILFRDDLSDGALMKSGGEATDSSIL